MNIHAYAIHIWEIDERRGMEVEDKKVVKSKDEETKIRKKRARCQDKIMKDE